MRLPLHLHRCNDFKVETYGNKIRVPSQGGSGCQRANGNGGKPFQTGKQTKTLSRCGGVGSSRGIPFESRAFHGKSPHRRKSSPSIHCSPTLRVLLFTTPFGPRPTPPLCLPRGVAFNVHCSVFTFESLTPRPTPGPSVSEQETRVSPNTHTQVAK